MLCMETISDLQNKSFAVVEVISGYVLCSARSRFHKATVLLLKIISITSL